MQVRAQVAMVMNLDKCIGCHTCSVTCKQVWTNRPGTEYVWFNNVETKPGLGYPRTYEDQERWRGGWTLDKKGRLKLRAGGRGTKLLNIFWNPDLPSIDDYYEPWTYDYQTLIDAPLQEHDPVARPFSQLTGDPIEVKTGPNWDDNLAGAPEHAVRDPLLRGIEEKVKLEYEQAFMFYLPRICEHCLNPSCVASCPSGAQAQAPLAVELPAALPARLVGPGARVSLARVRLDVVEPDVLGAGPVRPDLLAGDRAGVAADALVEVHDHRDLGADAHQ